MMQKVLDPMVCNGNLTFYLINQCCLTRLVFLPGIPIVKLEDKELAKALGVFAHPSLVIFRQSGKEPIIYAGDHKSQVRVLRPSPL